MWPLFFDIILLLNKEKREQIQSLWLKFNHFIFIAFIFAFTFYLSQEKMLFCVWCSQFYYIYLFNVKEYIDL